MELQVVTVSSSAGRLLAQAPGEPCADRERHNEEHKNDTDNDLARVHARIISHIRGDCTLSKCRSTGTSRTRERRRVAVSRLTCGLQLVGDAASPALSPTSRAATGQSAH